MTNRSSADQVRNRVIEPRLNGRFVLYTLTFLAVNLHLLRNVSPYYPAAPLTLYVLTFLSQRGVASGGAASLTEPSTIGRTGLPVTPWGWIFLFGTVYMTAVSWCYVTTGEFVTGVVRVWFAPPLMILAIDSVRSERDVTQLLRVLTVFMAVGCATVPLQVVTGPIPWFVESSTRAGMDRFGSLFGNLTAIGCVGGLGLIMALITPMSYGLRLVSCGMIGGSIVLSLQKAGMINLIAAPAIFLMFGGIGLKTRLHRVVSVMIPCVLFIIYMALTDERLLEYAGYMASKLGFAFAGVDVAVDDFDFGENLYERLFDNIWMLFDFYGWLGVFCGVGVMGLGGVAGLPEYEMAHNTYGDLLFSGGVCYLLSFLALQATVLGTLFYLKRLARSQGDDAMHANVCTLICLTLVFFINIPVGSGLLIQPNLCSPFFLTVGLLMGHYRRKFAEFEQHSRRRSQINAERPRTIPPRPLVSRTAA